jgi:hypothetical protein
VNRNKAAEPGIDVLIEQRDAVITACIDRLYGKLEDLPVGSLSVLISALARQYRATMDPFLNGFCDVVTARIRQALADDPDSPKTSMVRADIERLIPYVLLALNQMERSVPLALSHAGLDLFTQFKAEIPFSHLTQFVVSFPKGGVVGDSRWQELGQYCRESVEQSVDDFSILDLSRLLHGLNDELIARKLGEIGPLRPHSEWTIHALKEVSSLIGPYSLSKAFKSTFIRELERRKLELPPSYLLDILQNTANGIPGIANSALSILQSKVGRMTEAELTTALGLDFSKLPRNRVPTFLAAVAKQDLTSALSDRVRLLATEYKIHL